MIHNRRSTIIKIVIVVIILSLIGYLLLHRKPPQTQAMLAPLVMVKKPIIANISDYLTVTGNTVAFNSVDLVARVDGYLQSVNFTDGTFVKKGTSLLVIEPQPYAEKLKEAQASVQIQKAAYAYANAEYARQLNMYKQNATSLNNVQEWLAKREESQASIAKAIANEQIAAINYSYTHVNAPFDGRIGRHLVDPGNFVGNGQATKLATIDQLDPIYVYFNPNELDLLRIRAAARAQGFKSSEINKIPVYVALQNETGFPHEGRLDFINTSLNASTGTMEFRAILNNKDYSLLPGFFVQARIALNKPTPRLTVPDMAVQYDQIGAYLLVVNSANQVVLKRITIGSVMQGRRAILKGLDAHDNVIVEGLQNATPGNKVTLQQPA